ncbi:hypothetical protein Acidovoranil_35680 [Acidovorax sp. FG27]
MAPAGALAQEIDRLDSLASALSLPMPAALHVEALRSALPDVVRSLKAEYLRATGESPWAHTRSERRPTARLTRPKGIVSGVKLCSQCASKTVAQPINFSQASLCS